MTVRHNVTPQTLPQMRARQAEEEKDWKLLEKLANKDSIKEFYTTYAAYLKKEWNL